MKLAGSLSPLPAVLILYRFGVGTTLEREAVVFLVALAPLTSSRLILFRRRLMAETPDVGGER